MMTISILSRILVLATVVLILGVFWLSSSIKHSQISVAQSAPVTMPSPPKHEASAIRVAYPQPAGSASEPPAAALAPADPAPAVPPVQALVPPASVVPPASAAPAAPPPRIVPIKVSTAGTPAVSAAAEPVVAAPDASAPPQPVDGQQKVAALGQVDTTGTAAPAGTADQPPADPAGMVNINEASVDALNHLKGGGSIGQTIAKHRPYHSIDDLVTKRVLRRGVFEQIKNQISSN